MIGLDVRLARELRIESSKTKNLSGTMKPNIQVSSTFMTCESMNLFLLSFVILCS